MRSSLRECAGTGRGRREKCAGTGRRPLGPNVPLVCMAPPPPETPDDMVWSAPILRLWVLKDPARKPASWRARGRCCRQRAGEKGRGGGRCAGAWLRVFCHGGVGARRVAGSV